MTYRPAGWAHAVLKRIPLPWTQEAAWVLWWRHHTLDDLRAQ